MKTTSQRVEYNILLNRVADEALAELASRHFDYVPRETPYQRESMAIALINYTLANWDRLRDGFIRQLDYTSAEGLCPHAYFEAQIALQLKPVRRTKKNKNHEKS